MFHMINLNPILLIPQSKTYAVAPFYSTYKGGSTAITAAATDLFASHATISTIWVHPSKFPF